jgi:hypothetical protein
MTGTKAQIKRAFYLYLDMALPQLECELIEKRGNWDCPKRCDDCMFEQYMKKAKAGELPRKESGK